jgi:hypothetical protein
VLFAFVISRFYSNLDTVHLEHARSVRPLTRFLAACCTIPACLILGARRLEQRRLILMTNTKSNGLDSVSLEIIARAERAQDARKLARWEAANPGRCAHCGRSTHVIADHWSDAVAHELAV